MSKIRILDCTLRDGGYCNGWVFEKRNIDKIADALLESNVDLIEYGYWDSKSSPNIHSTRFSSLEHIPTLMKSNGLLMINYGEVRIDEIPRDSNKLWGFRVAFHKRDEKEAILFCQQLKEKGYRVFVQPMVTNGYSEEEFYWMLAEMNHILPDGFYIVDSFGSMQDVDVRMYMRMADEQLHSEICVGFHGHDNSKLAFFNAITAMDVCKRHTLYIDSTIMGMGRGAGNLGTENLIEYFNSHGRHEYQIDPILKVIDEVIYHFYADGPWGYSLPFYLAARHNCHPNYARYLDNRKTLTFTGINKIFERIPLNRRVSFDKDYIETVYYEYMKNEGGDCSNKNLWKRELEGRNLLLLAPGRTISEYREDIQRFINRQNPLVISVNFEFREIKADYVFISNERRYCEWKEDVKENHAKLLVTSNISAENYYLKINYSSLLSGDEFISDNAGLMAIRFLIQCGISDVTLAGFDGYQYDEHLNYVDHKMKMETVKIQKRRMNELIRKEMKDMAGRINIRTLTPSLYFG